MGRYLTFETIKLGSLGLLGASVAGVVWRVAGRSRWGAVQLVLTVVVMSGLAGRSDWPIWDATTAGSAVVFLLAGAGTARVLADPRVGMVWVAPGALISLVGIWAGVPETGPPVLVGGAVAGIAVVALLTGSEWVASAGFGLAVIVGWAALSGAVGRPWATMGGALCTGVAPWLAFPPLFARAPCRRSVGWWLLAAHIVLVVLAARWVGVAPHAGWHRIALIGAVGVAVTVAAGRRA